MFCTKKSPSTSVPPVCSFIQPFLQSVINYSIRCCERSTSQPPQHHLESWNVIAQIPSKFVLLLKFHPNLWYCQNSILFLWHMLGLGFTCYTHNRCYLLPPFQIVDRFTFLTPSLFYSSYLKNLRKYANIHIMLN